MTHRSEKAERETLSQVGDELLTGHLIRGWEVPDKVVIDGDGLRYFWPEDIPRKIVSPPELGLIDEFIKLVEAGPQAILEFARKRGVIQECGEVIEIYSGRFRGNSHVCGEGVSYCQEGHWQSFDLWQTFAKGTKALLSIGINLRDGNLVKNADDWYDAGKPIFYPEDPDDLPLNYELMISGFHSTDVATQKHVLAQMLQEWVLLLGMTPQLSWDQGRGIPYLTLTQGTLLESVTANLLFALTGTHSLNTCSSCGQLFKPKRIPRNGERRYCQNCGLKAGQRDASRDYRQREKGEQGG